VAYYGARHANLNENKVPILSALSVSHGIWFMQLFAQCSLIFILFGFIIYIIMYM